VSLIEDVQAALARLGLRLVPRRAWFGRLRRPAPVGGD